MFVRRARPTIALVVFACMACGLRAGSNLPSSARNEPPVGLVLDGSAFQRAAVRERVIAALETATGRHVVVVPAPSPTGGSATETFAAGLARTDPTLARYDWRERQCASHAAVHTGLEHEVDAVYRVTAEYARRTRPLGEGERTTRGAPGLGVRTLGVVGLAHPDTVVEEEVRGNVSVTTFTAHRASPPRALARKLERVHPTAFTPALDIAAVVTEAIARLPPFAAPQWDALARKLVTVGCPLLALAVQEARLGATSAVARGVRRDALAAIRRSAGTRTPKKVAGNDSAAEAWPAWGASPEPVDGNQAAGSEAGERAYSCDELCSIHMVELCNGEKTLWISNNTKWQATSCGTRRDEPFLQDCYRRQWLSGTFRDACVRPCESNAEDRDNLVRLLQTAGCRLDTSR